MRLNHLHFSSRKLELTRAFYEKHFGFHLCRQLGDTVVLTNAEGFLLAIDPARESTPPRSLHFGFCLSSPEEVTESFRDLKSTGAVIVRDLTRLNENAVHFYCEDPTGNRIEVGWFRNLMFPNKRSHA